MDDYDSVTYRQPTKILARSRALTHAVKLLTTRRKKLPIADKAYVRKARSLCGDLDYGSIRWLPIFAWIVMSRRGRTFMIQ